MSYVSANKASKFYNVHAETLRDWANKGQIEYIKTAGGHRRYKIVQSGSSGRKKYVYVRVLPDDEDGPRQIAYFMERYPEHEVVHDVGNSFDFKRDGFQKILMELFERNISEVVISSRDRFSRFGARNFFIWLFEHFGGRLTILDDARCIEPSKELVEDLVELVRELTVDDRK
jgi:putative resolvase